MKNIINRIFAKREKFHYFLLFFTFFLVVISQIIMRMEGMMGYFSAIETFEGNYITDDEMFNKSEITLEIKGEIPETIPEIYSNGERVGFFDTKIKNLVIETDTVIEVFCQEEPENVTVSVKWDEKVVTNYVKPYPIKLKKGFCTMARFSFLS